MREILFRGKRIDNGEWVYGYLTKQRHSPKDPVYSAPYLLECVIDNEIKGVMHTSFVIPETIGQYTGLHDKNGVEIYEGGICSLLYYQMRCVGCVEFNEKKSRFEIRSGGWTVLFHEAYKIEVIGNIHDNPELIEAAINRSMI